MRRRVDPPLTCEACGSPLEQDSIGEASPCPECGCESGAPLRPRLFNQERDEDTDEAEDEGNHVLGPW
jgi:predicted Zn-ribbon and HTH transcriptional regulator